MQLLKNNLKRNNIMSIAILGGIDRLIPHYTKQGRAMGFSNIKVFSKKMPNMVKRLSKYQAIVICTGNVAHTMVEGTIRMAQNNGIPVGRTHSSGVTAMKKCLEKISN
jgi:hypothetical protein